MDATDLDGFDYTVVDRMVDRIVAGFSPEKVVVFGSVASHTACRDSDVDILVVMETDLPKLRRSAPIRMALWGTKVPMDILVITPEEYEVLKDDEYSFVSEIVGTGYVAYGK